MSVIDVDEKRKSQLRKTFHLTFKRWIFVPESLWDCCNL